MSGRPRVGTFLGEPDCLVGINDPLAIERRGGRLGLSLRERHADTFERNNAKDDPRAVGWDQANQSIGQRSMLHLRKRRPKPSFSTNPLSAALPMLRSDAISEMMASTMTTAPYT